MKISGDVLKLTPRPHTDFADVEENLRCGFVRRSWQRITEVDVSHVQMCAPGIARSNKPGASSQI